GEVEAVVAFRSREQLASKGAFYSPLGGNFLVFCVAPGRQKGGDNLLVLLRQYRAGGIQQDAARLEALPQVTEQCCLNVAQLLYIGRAPQQLDIGVAANDTRGGARCVQQDAIIGLAVPPGVRILSV